MPNSQVAILIDGGFFTQRFKVNNQGKLPVRADVESLIKKIMSDVQNLSGNHCTDVLLRTFYYDALPFTKTISDLKGKKLDYSKSAYTLGQLKYLRSLRMIDQFAMRMGELSFSGWKLPKFAKNTNAVPVPDFRQKGVDMKIGLDMAWIAGKKTVDKLVLVTGDSDFISPIKLSRREGILVYLCPLGSTTLKIELKEHADFII